MYLRKLTIENIRALKRFEMTFPKHPAGWHVIIGDNGAGKSTLIKAISLGLIGPSEVRAAHPNFAEWLSKGAKRGSVELSITWDKQHDFTKGLGKANQLTAKVLLQPSSPLDGFLGATPLVEAVSDERIKPSPDKFLWSSSTKGWFSAGFGAFRRFTGGDTEHDKVYMSSPRCGAHLSVFGEDVALTEALRWLQEIDYQQLKARERKARQDANPLNLSDSKNLSNSFESDVVSEVRQLWQIAIRLQKSSLFSEAESLLRRALVLSEGIGSNPEHISVASSLGHLGMLLKATGRLIEAEPLLRRGLTIAEANLGSNNPKVAIYLNNLATLLQDTSQLTEAEALIRRALDINEVAFGPDHPEVAANIGNLALTLKHNNKSQEAEILMRRALTIVEASFGPDHSKVATNLNNLAMLLKDINRVFEAEPLMRRALAIDEANFGPDHPEVATDLNNLGLMLRRSNRMAEAEPLLRRALAISEANFGPDNPSVATRLSNLAGLLQDTNRSAEAESLYRRGLTIVENNFGDSHPIVATHLNNLAVLLQDLNQKAEAEALIRKALIINEKNFGPNHPMVAVQLSNLGTLLQESGRYIDAESLMRRALAIDEANFGPDHPNLSISINNLVKLLEVTNRLEEANSLVQYYEGKRIPLPAYSTIPGEADKSQKLPLNETDWLALRLRTFINESKLLPAGTEFKGMSAEGPVFQDGNGQKIAVTQLSDGFRSILSLAFELIRQLIRVYGLAAVFPPNGNHRVIELPGVILIDEVDTHLHPTWQTRIGQWFTDCFPQMQFIVTTHSPLICRAVTETTGSIWRLPTPGQGQGVEEVVGYERQLLRLGTVLDAYGTGLFGGQEVEQAKEATALLAEQARLNAKASVGKATPDERKRLRELQQLFSSIDAETEY
jgi:tetratricopeptide (TPR) repeat protein